MDERKRKKVSFAAVSRIEAFHHLLPDFMFVVFDLLPGDYIVADESSLRDFIDIFSSNTTEAWDAIEANYGLSRPAVKSEMLVDILAAIRMRGSVQ